jgi:hypothetical protein
MNRTTSKEIQKQDHIAPEASRIPAEGAGPRRDAQDNGQDTGQGKGHPPIDAAALTGDNGGGTSGNHGNGTAG